MPYGVPAVRVIIVSFINDFTLRCIQIALDHKEQQYDTRIFLSGAYRDYICVDCESYTVDENSRCAVLIT